MSDPSTHLANWSKLTPSDQRLMLMELRGVLRKHNKNDKAAYQAAMRVYFTYRQRCVDREAVELRRSSHSI